MKIWEIYLISFIFALIIVPICTHIQEEKKKRECKKAKIERTNPKGR